jgi:Flp pilus assembly protein TadD
MKFGRLSTALPFQFRWGAIALLALGIPAIATARPGGVRASFDQQMKQQIIQPSDAESELQTGIALTKQGKFAEAIPHFLAAQGHVREEYAANFNLALCYVATNQPGAAIKILSSLRSGGNATAEVNNLLAQAYIGANQGKLAWAAFQQAMAETPDDEKLYLFLADACMEQKSYDLGLQILAAGLQHLPRSALLHYQRGVFYSLEDLPDSAVQDYRLAEKLAPNSDTYYMAAGQAALQQGNISEAVRVTREGIRAGHQNYILLALFGSAVADSGAEPGETTFTEAETALKKSIAEHPGYEGSYLALGKLELLASQLENAVANLEHARQLAPADPSVYSHLAAAYRRQGNLAKAQEALEVLAKLDMAEAAKYKTSSPNKSGYTGAVRAHRKPQQNQ